MKFSTLPICLLAFFALLAPTSAIAEGTCAEYKYKGKQSKIEPTEKGLKIVTTAQASVLADDADLVDMALEEAEASARTAVQQFIKTEIDSRSDFSNNSVQNITINPDLSLIHI